MLHVQNISIDDFMITTTYKKRYNRPLVMLWYIDLAHVVLGQVVASLLSLCMTKMTAQMATRLTLRSFKAKIAKSVLCKRVYAKYLWLTAKNSIAIH